MFHVGTPELVIILVVALIVFGPKKLPEIGKSIGQGLRELRKASRDIMDTIEGRDEDFEPALPRVPDQSADQGLPQSAAPGPEPEKESEPNAADSYRD